MLFVSLMSTKAAVADPTGVRFGINCHLGETGNDEVRGASLRPTAEDRTRYFDSWPTGGHRDSRRLGLGGNRAGMWQRLPAGAAHDLVQKASERNIEIVAMVYAFPDWATGAKPARLAPGKHHVATAAATVRA